MYAVIGFAIIFALLLVMKIPAGWFEDDHDYTDLYVDDE